MRRFQIEQSATEFYTSHSGLALVGLAVNRYTALKKTLHGIVKRHGIPNIDLIRAYVGQLCLGKSDFDAIENVRLDRYFKEALGIKQMPSASRLRQRFDEDARALIDCVDDAAVAFIGNTQAPVTPLSTGHVALDMDVFPRDNSGAVKDGVSRTYKRLTAMPPSPLISARRAGASPMNCGARASGIAKESSFTCWSGRSPMRDS